MALDGFIEKIYRRYMVWKCRPSRVAAHLDKSLPGERKVLLQDGRRKIRVAALQLKLKLLKSPLHFADEMHRQVRKAVDRQARLAVFPEYNSLPLLGMLPGFEKIEEGYRKKAAGSPNNGSKKGSEDENSLVDVFKYMSPAVQPLVDITFSRLAKAYGIYIMAGSYPLAYNGGLFNRSFLYGPGGQLIGSQDKVHLFIDEAKWDLKRGSSFSIYETAIGNLALPVCMDATYFETFRILEHKGAEIALLPIADMQEYNYWLALRGIWPRVQESLLYGVKGALVGTLAGLVFSGRAGIFAPLELTPQQDGVLAEVNTDSDEAITVAELDLDALQELRQNHPWRDTNQALYSRYFPALYRQD